MECTVKLRYVEITAVLVRVICPRWDTEHFQFPVIIMPRPVRGGAL